MLQSFENYDIAHAPLHAELGNEGGSLKVLVDLRQFDIGGLAEPLARIRTLGQTIDRNGELQVARIFQQSAPLDGMTPAKAAAAFKPRL